MPYSINEGPCETAEGKGGQYAVVKDDDGTQMGCHTTRDAALRQIAALGQVRKSRSSLRVTARLR